MGRYLKWFSANAFSNKMYDKWIRAEERLALPWVQETLASVKRVEEYREYWLYLLRVKKMKTTGGAGAFCKILAHNMPPIKNESRTRVGTCSITGLQRRPCFEVTISKNFSAVLLVHRDCLDTLQMAWAFVHGTRLVEHVVGKFKARCGTGNLMDAVRAFHASDDFARLLATLMQGVGAIRSVFELNNSVCV